MQISTVFFFASVWAAVCAAFTPGQRHEEVFVTMRDGINLKTVIVFPRGYDPKKSVEKYPVIMDRSPYGYTDLEWITDIFVPFGYVAIGQDMRGTVGSEGNFSLFISDKDDSEDLGNWIVEQDWSNGEIFTFGASADGIGSIQTIFNNPKWLKGQYVAWFAARMYQILFPFGTYKQETAEAWLLGIEMPNPDVVYDNIAVLRENEFHSDEFWSQVELGPEQYKNVKFPTAFWAGWYDLFSTESIIGFTGYNELSDESVRFTSKITIDPLGHCLEGADYFPQNAVMGRTGLVLSQMLEVYGIRPVARNSIKNITFYVMSSDDEQGLSAGQFWTSLEQWPTASMEKFYLQKDGQLLSTLPSLKSSSLLSASSSFVFDPSSPQTTAGGCNLPPSIGGTIACGPLDQGEIDKRDDVLVFDTPPVKENEEIYFTGPMFATLFVSSDAIDTDFMVRISDVYPTGEVRLLNDNAIRMRWREGGLTPVYMTKDTVYEVNINLWNISYALASGHSLRVAISSSNTPRFSVNPNNGLLLADSAYPGTPVVATNTVFHSALYPSHISLPIVKRFQLPEVHALKEAMIAYPDIIKEENMPYLNNLLNKLVQRHGSVKK